MTLPEIDIKAAAEALFHSEMDHEQIGLISQSYPAMTLAEAYLVQDAVLALKRASGRRVIGWKVGLTSRALQRVMKIDTPSCGALLDDMAYADAAEIAAGTYFQPRVEAEIAFILQAPLRGPHVTREHVLAAVHSVAPALEIVDTRTHRADPKTGKPRDIIDTIADNASAGGIVLGEARHRLDTVDLRWTGAILRRDGKVEETGLGAGVLDDPVEAVLWLVHHLAEFGAGLAPDDIVLSGAFMPPIEAPSGSLIEADFGSFGWVSCSFD